MRIAHIILAHKNPSQLEYLINALSHPGFDIYVHLDKNTDGKPFVPLSKLKQVHFVKKRVACNFGGYSIVEATITSIEQIKASGIEYSFVNLLSAQDFPLKPAQEIYDFFNTRRGFSFMSFEESTDNAWWKEAEAKYKKFHLTDANFKGKYVVQGVLNILMPKRGMFDDTRLLGGNKSAWWTITYECAKYLLEYLRKNTEVVKSLKLTWGSEEYILTTILMNSRYQAKIINNNYRYIDWSEGKYNPKTLTIDDYDNLVKSGNLFARKFDTDIDNEILLKLNDHILALEAQ